jgi:hypothetical protein
MKPRRALILACLTGVLAGACAKKARPVPPALPGPDTGVVDTSSDPGPEAPDRRPGCPPGATDEDCQLCQYGGETCQRACPKVDCSPFPVPAACASFCGKNDCCECRRREIGNEYWWRPPDHPIACGTFCSGARAAWQELMRDPRMKACQVDQDCSQAGGPNPPSCDCRPAIGGCFQAVNSAAYQSLGAAALEQQYLASCPDQRICDCAPGLPGCVNGTCEMKQMFCCLCPDAGRF